MAKLKYIGDVPTRVRSNGEKVRVLSNKSFTCTEAEAKALLESGYKKYFKIIEIENKELLRKQEEEEKRQEELALTQTDEFKAEQERLAKEKAEQEAKKQEEKKVEQSNEKLDTFKKRIEESKSIDELNEVSTDVANDEEYGENEELATLVEEKMKSFIEAEQE